MYREEIERIIELFNHLDEVDIENNIEQITNAGFANIDEYNFVKLIHDRFNTFMDYVQDWEGLEERIPSIQETIILIQLLRRDNVIL